MDRLEARRNGLGSLAWDRACCVHPNFAAATDAGDSSVDRGIDERGNLRRAGFSRLLPEAVSCLYLQHLVGVLVAGLALRDWPRLSGAGGEREDRVFWRSVWLACVLARESAARHDRAC